MSSCKFFRLILVRVNYRIEPAGKNLSSSLESSMQEPQFPSIKKNVNSIMPKNRSIFVRLLILLLSLTYTEM